MDAVEISVSSFPLSFGESCFSPNTKKIGKDTQKSTLYLLAVLLGPVPVVGIVTNSFALNKL